MTSLLRTLLCRAPARYAALLIVMLASATLAQAQSTADPGRLFYTPAQRAQLEAARTHNVTRAPAPSTTPASARAPAAVPSPPPARRYNGVVIRSDGTTTRWVNGAPEVGSSSVPGLKPGQLRANGKVYEPYEVLPPAAATP